MKKVVRLTESDLVRIVKRVINEDDGAFSFGDKIKSKLGSALFGIKPSSDEESKLADAILSKVESGDFSVQNSDEYSNDITYDFTVTLADGDYFCTVYKNIPPGSPTSTWYYGTKVKTPDGEKIHFNEKGFANKLIRLIKNSDKVSRYKFKG